ncbi:LOW QUALITY PROTEIN: hypothetical protein QTO34_003107 [Cnephaeus nilssonii]|uniref:Uncharacterized protein n=1 Tax=Cnephaeus nilssonii TaxID=3371016 RepID=A0AA40HQ27_CNENI|nr:LOW QUALITY PROTEIN: hypothetical protein QTO34_003107 [Eptesicus nilssonii]
MPFQPYSMSSVRTAQVCLMSHHVTCALQNKGTSQTAGRNAKLARQPSIELPSMAVASTKSRWETGEVQAQSATKSPSCKDPSPGKAVQAETTQVALSVDSGGEKVAWQGEGRRCNPPFPASPGLSALLQEASRQAWPGQDIVAGDMSKKSLWEQEGGSKTSSTIKVESVCRGGRGKQVRRREPRGTILSVSRRASRRQQHLPSAVLTFALGLLPRQSTPSGKRYKFVATGHGKYEKVLMDEGPGP